MPLDGKLYIDDTDEVVQVLIRGRARIERGWHQGSSRHYADKDRVCAGAAINLFYKPTDAEHTAGRYLYNALPEHAVPHGRRRSVPVWNDLPTTRQQDVLDLFDRAIAQRLAEARHDA